MGTKTRVSVVLLAMAIVLVGISVGSIGASSDKKGESDLNVIIIDNEDYDRDRKGPVTFTHRKHALDYKIQCWECHHDYNNEGINIWNPWGETLKCKECHDASEAIDKAVKLQTAYHINCKNCHKTMAKENKKTGPYRNCLTCHQKK